MAPVDLSQFLTPGQTLTLSFKQSGLNPIRAGVADVTSALQYLALPIKNPSVVLVGGVFGLFANQYDITFQYSGDGSDVLANLQVPIQDALNNLETLASFDFLGANAGAGGVAPNSTPGTSPGLPALIPSTSGLWAIAIIVLLVVFVMSGGAGVVRGVARAAA